MDLKLGVGDIKMICMYAHKYSYTYIDQQTYTLKTELTNTKA